MYASNGACVLIVTARSQFPVITVGKLRKHVTLDNRWMDGGMDGLTDRQTDRQTDSSSSSVMEQPSQENLHTFTLPLQP